jgi:TonB family protein
MKRRSILVLITCLIPLRPQAQDVQQRAETLLDKARQLSDIRSPNAPAFRLKATFSFVGKNLETAQGTYTEVWVSNSQWRRETIVNDWHRIEVGGPTRLWLLDSAGDFPEPAAQLPGVLAIFPSSLMSLAFDSISDHPELDPPAECAVTRPDSRQQRSAFCFDKRTGLPLERILPELRPKNAVVDSCDYGSFQRMGSFLFPREIACFEDRHRKLDAKVTELDPEPKPDPALFTPPQGAIELGRCPVKPDPPRATPHFNPRFPSGVQTQSSQVTLSLVVDTKGKPQDVKVVGSGGTEFDQAAISAVRDWRFKPGICRGEPMPMPILVQVDF